MKKLGKFSLIALGLGIFVAALSTIPSRPVSGAQGPDPVIVTNTPLFMRDVDNPARQPFQIGFPFTMNSGTQQVFQSFTVPAGKRLSLSMSQWGAGLYRSVSTCSSSSLPLWGQSALPLCGGNSTREYPTPQRGRYVRRQPTDARLC